jgi:hypothetical protein
MVENVKNNENPERKADTIFIFLTPKGLIFRVIIIISSIIYGLINGIKYIRKD